MIQKEYPQTIIQLFYLKEPPQMEDSRIVIPMNRDLTLFDCLLTVNVSVIAEIIGSVWKEYNLTSNQNEFI